MTTAQLAAWTFVWIILAGGGAIYLMERLAARQPTPPPIQQPACPACAARDEIAELNDLYEQPAYGDD